MTDHDDAARYARSAGDVLLGIRDHQQAPWALGDAGDVTANRHLLDLLAAEHPDDRILSEESADDPRRVDADRVWIIDPLDGTNEYGERGRADWAIHVALWEKGDLVAGAVSLPAVGVTLDTHPDTKPMLPPKPDRKVRLITSRNRAP